MGIFIDKLASQLLEFAKEFYKGKKLKKQISHTVHEASSGQSQNLLALCMDDKFSSEIFRLAKNESIDVLDLVDLGISISNEKGFKLSRPQIIKELKDFARKLYNSFAKLEAESGKMPAAYADFLSQIEREDSLTAKLGQKQHPPGSLFGDIPEPPSHYLKRPKFVNKLKEKILQAEKKPIGIMSSEKLGLIGMGGIGKTVLASIVVRDQKIKDRFPDGIFWITFGQEPNILLRQAQLAKELSGESESFTDIQEGKSRLKQLLIKRSSLIVLDDLWEMPHLSAFNVLGHTCQMLITTRNASLIKGLGAKEFGIDVLSPSQARKLLAKWANRKGLPTAAYPILKECGYLPLAVAMIGAMLRGKESDRWEDMLEQLKKADLKKINQHFPDYPYPNLFKALQVSVDNLGETLYECYKFFAIFPEDVHIPSRVLYMLWAEQGLNEIECKDYIDELVDLSLLQRDTQGKLYPHDLQRDYLRIEAKGKLQVLHQELLDAYDRLLSSSSSKSKNDISRWANGPKDGYFFENFCYHLSETARFDDLKKLLLNFSWLQAKLDECDLIKLISDYGFLSEDPVLKKIWQSLHLSAHILSNDSSQLPGQIHGRLGDELSPSINKLINGISVSFPWLRTLRASLAKPGGALLRVLKGHSESVKSVAVSADGRLAVSGSDDKTVRVWDLQTSESLHVLKGHSESVKSVAVSADGRLAVSGSDDETLRVWDLQTGESLHVLQGHSAIVDSVAVSADGRLTVSGSDDETLRVWDLQTGESLHVLKWHSASVDSVAVSADGHLAVSGSGRALRVWDLQTGESLHVLQGHSASVDSVAVSADGRHAVSGSRDKTVRVWDLQTGEFLHVLQGHSESVNSVVVSADGRLAVSGSGDNTVRVWDLQTGECLHVLKEHSDSVGSIAVSADGRLAVSGSRDNTVRVWDLQTGESLHVLKDHSARVGSVAVSADGRLAVSGSRDETLRVWDLQTGESLHVLKGHSSSVNSVAVSADGRLAVSGSGDKTLRVWDLQTGESLHVLKGHSARVGSVAVSADGRHAVSGSRDKTVRVWDLQTGKFLHVIQGHSESAKSAAVSADGRLAVSGSYGETLRVWDLQTGESLHFLQGHSKLVNSVVVSADGRLAVSGSDDKTVRVWDLQTGESLHVLKGHSSSVNSVAVSADGRLAVSGSDDETVRVWDLKYGKFITKFYADEVIESVSADMDGLIFAAGDRVGKVHLLLLENFNKEE